jgi:hypothetical protein
LTNDGNSIVPTISEFIRAFLEEKNRRQIFEPTTAIERGEYGKVGTQTRYEQSEELHSNQVKVQPPL